MFLDDGLAGNSSLESTLTDANVVETGLCKVGEFFYPKGLPRKKVENFVSIVNLGMEDNFFRCFSIQLTSNQLDALLAEMEAGIDIPDNILKAVSVVGKNINQHGTAIWALNRNVFIDGNGNVVNPEDHGLIWIGHLVLEPGRIQSSPLHLKTFFVEQD
ncbi:hypothetical protein OS493_012973 [Desmophyllum pertusum]|uniref:Uncharacterized protein n=1 Tax=Desmophyllum pertusum TaxID=174260 RepID=A0A9W9Z1E5_9CNID|nr:hypothetical protein OS493_012973 [Desmophyllum pertusum]